MRSSSYGAEEFCEHQYFLDYTLGISRKANKKAAIGVIVHKALELLAAKKLCLQKGEAHLTDESFGDKSLDIKTLNDETVMAYAWRYCTNKFTEYTWEPADLKQCCKLLDQILSYKDGMFNPLNLSIVSSEQYFDIEIIKPWAHYSYNVNGKPIEGYLRLRGTIDLIIKHSDTIYEIVDWKTGKYRSNINTGEEKTIDKLLDDAQLRIYHYAANYLYPDIEEMFVTIFYAQAGGPFSLPFSKKDLTDTEDLIRTKFEKIKFNKKPKLIWPHWKCTYLCDYNKQTEDGQTICKKVEQEVIALGLDKVTNKRININKLTEYTGGGKY